MKILYMPAYFLPEKAASSYLAENRLEAFANAGLEVELYVPTPCRGLSKDEQIEYKNKRYKKEFLYENNVIVKRFRLYSEGKNPLLRAVRYLLCWIIQFYYGLCASKVDCIYLASTPPIQGLLGAFLKKIKHIPFVYNLQDIFPDSLVGTGLAKKGGLLWKIGRVIENFTYKNADKIIVISEDFKKNIMAKGVPEEKIEVVYNWVDQNAVVDIPRSQNKLFDAYGLDRSKFYLSYCGNIGLTQNMDLLLEVMKELASEFPDIHLVLVGEGAYKKNVEAFVANHKLKTIHLLPFQPYEDISYVFSLGDVGLVISKPGVGANSVPSKTWSIMSASRPVLANFDENELKSIVEGHNCGLFTKAGDKAAFKSSIIQLYNDHSLCENMGVNGRQFVLQNLTKEVGTKRYVEVLKSVID
ncbi:MAG: glycosyltransferase family 4 protein [Paludibacteraceae bacterium]|nr:glycosyltransferase family 4 protein [Paludibacteraceae bacterium]